MKIYELTYLMPQTVSEDELKALQEKIHSFITEKQGTLERIEDVVKTNLGFPIGGQRNVFSATLSFHSEPEELMDLGNKIKSEKQVLRHMIVIKKPLKIVEIRRRVPHILMNETKTETTQKITEKPKKVEIKEIEKKLEEILGE
ncbi:MAG: 30S ribosomal protein S6 [Patescibacteria group bacterium]